MNRKNKILAILFAMVILLAACGQVNNNEIQNAIEKENSEKVDSVENPTDSEANKDKDNTKEKIRVVASFYPIYDLVNRVGGDKVDLINLTKSGSAHGFEPSIEDMKNIVDADIFIINGAGFEGYIDDIKTNNPDLNIVDLSEGIELLSNEGHTHENHDHDHDDNQHEDGHEDHDHDHENEKHEHENDNDHENEGHDHENEGHDGHNHGPNDPHIWLSLDNAIKMMETIKDELSKLNSDSMEFFQENYDQNKAKFEAIDKEFESKFEAHKGKSFVVPHEAFAYLTDEYDLVQVGIEGINSDSEPNIQRMAEIVDIMNKEQTKTVFYEYGKSDKVANTIASEIGGNVKPISTLEVLNEKDLENGKDYLSLMQMNLQNILDSFEGK